VKPLTAKVSGKACQVYLLLPKLAAPHRVEVQAPAAYNATCALQVAPPPDGAGAAEALPVR
jgi:hypothetical protein